MYTHFGIYVLKICSLVTLSKTAFVCRYTYAPLDTRNFVPRLVVLLRFFPNVKFPNTKFPTVTLPNSENWCSETWHSEKNVALLLSTNWRQTNCRNQNFQQSLCRRPNYRLKQCWRTNYWQTKSLKTNYHPKNASIPKLNLLYQYLSACIGCHLKSGGVSTINKLINTKLTWLVDNFVAQVFKHFCCYCKFWDLWQCKLVRHWYELSHTLCSIETCSNNDM
jgi:hypothetical protein